MHRFSCMCMHQLNALFSKYCARHTPCLSMRISSIFYHSVSHLNSLGHIDGVRFCSVLAFGLPYEQSIEDLYLLQLWLERHSGLDLVISCTQALGNRAVLMWLVVGGGFILMLMMAC